MKKIIVTHTNPDLDAIAAIWLIKRFWKGWEKAEIKFVPAGESYNPKKSQTNISGGRQICNDFEIVHVDTGLGEFDHHQRQEDTCSAKLVFEWMKCAWGSRSGTKFAHSAFHQEALERLVSVVNDIDHFRQVFYPEPTADYHDFSLVSILDGLNLLYNNKGEGDIQLVEHGLICLDGIYKILRQKVRAKREIQIANYKFQIRKFGKIIGLETTNDTALDLAQKMGYKIVVRKDPKKGYVRIKAQPDSGIDLTPLYERLKKADPGASWFLHISKKMVLNGTPKNPKMRATKLTLEEIMEMIKESGGNQELL